MKRSIYWVLVTCFFSTVTNSSAQQCAIISMNHLGGNGTEQITGPCSITYPNGDFSLTVGTNSTTGSINTSCVHTTADGTGGGVLVTYDENYNALIGQFCIPHVDTFFGKLTYYFFPQSNGDTIFVGNMVKGGTDYDIGIERRDANGNIIWVRSYGGTGADGLGYVQQTGDGGFIIATSTNSDDGDVGFHYGSPFTGDIWAIKVDSNGNKVWSKVIGGSGTDLILDLKVAPDGGCYIFGVTNSTDYDAIGMQGVSDLYIVKLDSLGNKQWHKCLGGSDDDGSGYDFGIHSISDKQGGFYILNRTASHDGDVRHRMPDGTDFWLLHIDSMANILWENTYGGNGYQYPSAFCQTSDGKLWLGGYFASGTSPGGMIDVVYGSTDAWVVQVDTLGNFINERVLGTDRDEYLDVLYPLANNTVLAAGRYNKANGGGATSPGFPTSSEGWTDVFLAHLGPETVGISEMKKDFSAWQLYPNPAGDQITATIEERNSGKCKIQASDAQGRVVFKAKFTDMLKISTETWPAGVYIIEITNKDRKGVKKVTIKH